MFDLKRKKLNQYLCLAIASALGCSFWSHLGAKELSEPIAGSYHASQPGENLIAANGTVFEHGNSFGESPQKISGSFGMLLANVGNAYQLDLNGNFSNSVYYDGAVITNWSGTQIIGKKDDKISSIAISSGHSYDSMSYYNNRGSAIANYSAGQTEGHQEIFSRIDSIGSPEQNFTFGVVERGKGIQYIESIGVLYANPIGILSGIDDLSGPHNRTNEFFNGRQIIKSIGSVIVDSLQQKAEKINDPGNGGTEIRNSWPVFGVLNWNQIREDGEPNQPKCWIKITSEFYGLTFS